MDAILVKHKMVVDVDGNSGTLYFLANPTTYLGLKSETGVEQATADTDKNKRTFKTAEMLNGNDVDRLAIYYQVPGRSGTKKASILCAAHKTQALMNKGSFSYRGGTVTSVRKTRDATFY